MNVNEYLSNWAACYKKDLTENILPFWLKNGLDRKHGGVYTCLDRDGSLMDTTKSVWFQGRFGFIAAYAYNNIEKNPEWLAASKSCIDFIEAHCFDADGRMYFEVMEDGTPLRKRRYVFSEGFAAIAMSEYAIASGDHTYAEKALELFKPPLHGERDNYYQELLMLHLNLCISYTGINEFEKAEKHLSDAILFNEIAGSAKNRFLIDMSQAHMLWKMGNEDEVRDHVEELVEGCDKQYQFCRLCA